MKYLEISLTKLFGAMSGGVGTSSYKKHDTIFLFKSSATIFVDNVEKNIRKKQKLSIK